MEMGRSLWLAMLIISAIMVSFHGEAATIDGQTATAGGPPPETNVLCVSKCGTCPTVCSSPSPPPPPSSPNSDGSGYSSPSPPSSTTPTSPPYGQQPQAKGRNPSGYYYFLTAGSGRTCAASSVSYTLLLLAILPVVIAV